MFVGVKQDRISEFNVGARLRCQCLQGSLHQPVILLCEPPLTCKFKDIMPGMQSQDGREIGATGTDSCFYCSLSALLIIYPDTGLDPSFMESSDIVYAFNGWLGCWMGTGKTQMS